MTPEQPGWYLCRFQGGALIARYWDGRTLKESPENAVGWQAANFSDFELLRKEGGDDSAPIDEAWLRSVGFEQAGAFALRIEAPSQLPEGVALFYLECTDYQNIPCPWELWNRFRDKTPPEGACLPCVPKTRGDVKRLAEALAIPLGKGERT